MSMIQIAVMLGTEQMLTGSKCLLENVLAISWSITKYKEKLMDDSIKEAMKEELKKQLELISEQGVKSTFAIIYAYVTTKLMTRLSHSYN